MGAERKKIERDRCCNSCNLNGFFQQCGRPGIFSLITKERVTKKRKGQKGNATISVVGSSAKFHSWPSEDSIESPPLLKLFNFRSLQFTLTVGFFAQAWRELDYYAPGPQIHFSVMLKINRERVQGRERFSRSPRKRGIHHGPVPVAAFISLHVFFLSFFSSCYPPLCNKSSLRDETSRRRTGRERKKKQKTKTKKKREKVFLAYLVCVSWKRE